jgi:chromosome segregation ATPase
MKSQLASDPQGYIHYIRSKLRGLKHKANYLARVIQLNYEKSNSPSPNDIKGFSSISFEDSDTFDLDLNLMLAKVEDQIFSEEIDEEIYQLNIRLAQKDKKISELKQTISNFAQEKDEITNQLEDEVGILKHQIAIYKHHIKSMRNDIKILTDQLTLEEKNFEQVFNQLNLSEEKNKNLESKIIGLQKAAYDKDEEIKYYENIIESTNSTRIGGSQDRKKSNFYSLQLEKDRLSLEVAKANDEKLKMKKEFDEKYEKLLGLHEKILEEKSKQSKKIQSLKEDLDDLKKTMIDKENLAIKSKIKLQEELMARICQLRQEKHELRKKLDFTSRDLGGDYNTTPSSLGEEILKLDDKSLANTGRASILKIDSMTTEENKILKEHLYECEKHIEDLNKAIETYKSDRDFKITQFKNSETKSRSGMGSPRSPTSLMLKIRPNPLVVTLFNRRL